MHNVLTIFFRMITLNINRGVVRECIEIIVYMQSVYLKKRSFHMVVVYRKERLEKYTNI